MVAFVVYFLFLVVYIWKIVIMEVWHELNFVKLQSATLNVWPMKYVTRTEL